METLVVVGQYRDQYHHGSSAGGGDRFACSPSKGFSDISCRFFQSESGIRPNPFSCCDACSSVDEKPCSSPKTPAPVRPKSQENKHLTSNEKSSAIPITSSKASDKCRSLIDEFACPELWAGPAYSNSPPPSSLPIPKFSLRQKRSSSFELPDPSPNTAMRSLTKSAPPSPGREPVPSPSNSFLSIASATEDLRRILHLDVSEE